MNNIKDTRRADRDVKTRMAANVRNALAQKGFGETDLTSTLGIRPKEGRALWAGNRAYVVKHLPPIADLLDVNPFDVASIMFKGLK